jgi:NAD(P)-dependent dehydrogenase (short-subunit alcohol dehydrogenase family)
MSTSTMIVTGATSGIGFHTAAAVAASGAHVVLVGRSEVRCQAAVAEIQRLHPDADVAYRVTDLSDQTQVVALADDIQRQYERLDVLINNAGAFFAQREESADGIEMTWALNHMAPFVLTTRLLPLLRASAPARVITVSSAAHRMGRMNFADVEGRQRYSGWPAYAQSKLANLLFTYELADRLRDADVTVNALHPGFVASGFGQNNHSFTMRAFAWLQKKFAISSEQGAQTSIYLAMSPQVAQVTGRYFVDSTPVPAAAHAYDVTARRRLWRLSEDLVRL